MAKLKDMTGQTFTRWTVIEYKGSGKWLCKCSCGTERVVRGFALRDGSSKSCGCLTLELLKSRTKETIPALGYPIKHGMSGTIFYRRWDGMKKRCNHDDSYKGEITYDPRWEDFENFKEDMYDSFVEHASIHGEENTSLDRINGFKGYSKENCQWLTVQENISKPKDRIWKNRFKEFE